MLNRYGTSGLCEWKADFNYWAFFVCQFEIDSFILKVQTRRNRNPKNVQLQQLSLSNLFNKLTLQWKIVFFCKRVFFLKLIKNTLWFNGNLKNNTFWWCDFFEIGLVHGDFVAISATVFALWIGGALYFERDLVNVPDNSHDHQILFWVVK